MDVFVLIQISEKWEKLYSTNLILPRFTLTCLAELRPNSLTMPKSTLTLSTLV